MSVKMTRSEIPASRVAKLTEQRYKGFADFKGRNPTSNERALMKKEIVNLAKRANQDRRL